MAAGKSSMYLMFEHEIRTVKMSARLNCVEVTHHTRAPEYEKFDMIKSAMRFLSVSSRLWDVCGLDLENVRYMFMLS